MNNRILSAIFGRSSVEPPSAEAFAVGDIRVTVSEQMDCGHRDIRMMYGGLREGEICIGYVNSAGVDDLIHALQETSHFIETADAELKERKDFEEEEFEEFEFEEVA